MKKNLFCLTVVGFFLTSCSKNVDEITSSSLNSRRVEMREMLRQMNEENPCSAVGIGHNKMVSHLLHESIHTTRSNDSVYLIKSDIKQAVINHVDSLLTADMISNYTIQEFGQGYDTVMARIFDNPPSSHLLSTYISESFDDLSRQRVATLETIVSTSNSASKMLKDLRILQNEALTLPSHQQDEVLTLISVAANSCVYWDEALEELPLAYQPQSIGTVVSADIDAAGLTSCGNFFLNLFKKAISWKYVVAMSAGASTWAAVKTINWTGVWNSVDSWLNDLW